MSDPLTLNSASFSEGTQPPAEVTGTIILSKLDGRQTKPRALAPKLSNATAINKDVQSICKPSKSRNGCVTCKAKRMKCDESKPFCQQCARRNVTCAGYKMDIRWKPVGKPLFIGSKANKRPRKAAHTPHIGCQQFTEPPVLSQTSEISYISRNERDAIDLNYHVLSSFAPTEPEVTLTPDDTFMSSVDKELVMDQTELNRASIQQAAVPTVSPPCFPCESPKLFDLDLASWLVDMDVEGQDPHESQLLEYYFLDNDTQTNYNHGCLDKGEEPNESAAQAPFAISGQLSEFIESFQRSPQLETSMTAWTRTSQLSPSTTESRNSVGSTNSYHFDRLLQPQKASPELIAQLFEQQTCTILCVADETLKNPWKMLIWPLAQESSSLYHALAAMTCLHLCKQQPQLRLQGIEHMQRSIEALDTSMNRCDMNLDATIATMLALGFAKQWDHQMPSTGMDHIRSARLLIEQAMSTSETSGIMEEKIPRLDFFARTWTYMDVIARLTANEVNNPGNVEFMSAYSGLNATCSNQRIDPLMGYASTLFPLISRVVDIVNCVRKRTAKRNSPAIISQAVGLKKAIETWEPPVDLDCTENVTYNMAESIQTAEAYRWATLLLLRQAVPELPSLYSFGDVAQKVLLFLATTPLTSRTTIVHILPLMIAGCEAQEEEDRNWVRERWQQMSKRMITGIVDNCLEVTIEVWGRRDVHAALYAPCHTPSTRLHSPSVLERGLGPDTDELAGYRTLSDVLSCTGKSSNTCQCIAKSQARVGTSDFPESVAFKRGADLLTRAGCIDYTVKGRLHWLGVMKDWDWEIMLG